MGARRIPLVVALLILAMTAVAAVFGYRADERAAQNAREDAALKTRYAVSSLIGDLSGRITDLAGFFEASEQVTANEFEHFTTHVIDGSVASLARWSRSIPRSGRTRFERHHGPIMEVGPGGVLRRAADRPDYVVVRFVNTRSAAGSHVGLDVSADRVTRQTLERAASTGRPQLTGLVRLGRGQEFGFITFAPVFAPGDGKQSGRDRAVRGFVSGGFQASDLAAALGPALPAGAGVRITHGGDTLLEHGAMDGKVVQERITIGGRMFELGVSYDAAGRMSRAGVAIVIGFLLALLGGLLARQILVTGERTRRERDAALRSHEQQGRATRELLAHLPDLGVMEFDEELRLSNVTGGLLERAGWSIDDIEGMRFERAFSNEPADAVAPLMRAALYGREGSVDITVTTGGLRLWVQALPIGTDPPRGLLVLTNVTPLLEARDAQELAEERFQAMFEEAPIGMALLGSGNRFSEVNDALCQMLGLPRAELIGTAPADLSHPEDLDVSAPQLAELYDGDAGAVQFEKRYLRPDGSELWAAVHVTLLHRHGGERGALLAQFVDISERRAFQRRLEELADQDPLTGLPNRRAFSRAIDAHAADVARYGARGALVMVDLDHFKTVNDRLGHEAGDEFLTGVADILRGALREGDTVARLGGDELAVLLPHADRVGAVAVAGKLLEEIAELGSTYQLGSLAPTATIGIALFQDGIVEAVDAMRAADRAMYAAKASGRARYVVFEPDSHEALWSD